MIQNKPCKFINHSFFTILTRLMHTNTITAKLDSGASQHYVRPTDIQCLRNIVTVPKSIVGLPNKTFSKITQQGLMNLDPTLTPTAQTGHVLNDLKSSTLLSAGQLCDDNCIVVLSKDMATVQKNNNTILQGPRNYKDNLWNIQIPIASLPNTTTQVVNAIIRKDQSKRELANYLYECCLTPPLSTFRHAITKNNFITWPGMDDPYIRKYFNETINTAKGHLDQEMKNLQSTKLTPDTEKDFFPHADWPNIKQHTTYTVVHKQTAFFDLTGKFPHQSAQGNNYLMVTYDYDSNAILVKPIPNREAASITKAWELNHARLAKVAAAPKHNILDNEFSADLQRALNKHGITYEMVPPHIHRRNAAERAIRTFKNHFLAGLAGVDPDFPIKQWDHLLQQAEITLNLLRSSRVNQKLSAYTYLFGNFDFNKTPLAPPGTKVAVHIKPDKRKSWAYHVELGFYVGPAMDHYRCFKCYIPATGGIRVADTVKFYPHNNTFPAVTMHDQFVQSLSDIIYLLQHPDHDLPFLQFGDKAKNATT